METRVITDDTRRVCQELIKLILGDSSLTESFHEAGIEVEELERAYLNLKDCQRKTRE